MPTPALPAVLCIDDNKEVAEALREALLLEGSFEWCGWAPTADALAAKIAELRPAIVLLDVDMPGLCPFAALAALARPPDAVPVRVIMFSGQATAELIDRALDAGAWGFILKADGTEALLACLRAVLAGHLAFSPECLKLYLPS